MREAREVFRAAIHPSMARRSGAHGLWPPAPPRGAGVAGGDLSAVSGLHPRETRAAAAPAARELPRAAGAPPPRRRGPGPSSRPTWRDRSRARRLLRYSLVFRLLDLIQLGLHVGQCPEDLPPRFVLLLQARRSRPMMRSVQGGVTLLEPLALHGFLQHAHHEVGFLHEFVDQMGPFPWFHVWTPFRLLVLPATLLTQPALPFRLLDICQEGTHH